MKVQLSQIINPFMFVVNVLSMTTRFICILVTITMVTGFS